MKWFSDRPVRLRWALVFLILGLGLLAGALFAAYSAGPTGELVADDGTPVVKEVRGADGSPVLGADGKPATEPVIGAIADTNPMACAMAMARVAPSTDDERFRLLDVEPRKTVLGRHLCLVVAGVVPRAVVSAAQREVDQKGELVVKAQQDLDAVPPGSPASMIEARRKAVKDAETAYQTALAAGGPGVAITLYLNNMKAPVTVLAQRTSVPQPLFVRLSAPSSAAAPEAKFWRDLVRGVSSPGSGFGEVDLAVGASRSANAADIPEAGAGAEHTVRLYVFSKLPIGLGLAAFAALALAFGIYAYSAPILRDNALTRAMLPGELEAAKLGIEEARATQAKAVKDLDDARAAGGPVTGSVVAAAADAAVAVNRARNRLGRVVAAYGHSLEDYEKALAGVAKSGAALQAATATATGSLKAVSDAEAARSMAYGQLRSLSGLAAATDALAALPATPVDQALTDARTREAAAKAFDAAIGDLVAKTITREEARGTLDAAGTDASLRATANAALASAEAVRATAMDEVNRLAVAANVDVQALTGPLQAFADRAKEAEDARIAYRPLGDAVALSNASAADLARIVDPPSFLDDKAIGSFSLGRTQMAFWLFLVIAAYIFIALSIGQIYGIFTDPVVYLLGISGLTTAGAVLLESGNRQDRVSRSFLTDILSADEGVQLQRLQAVVFTLVLGGVFVYVVASSFSMPDYDPMQLLLMGLVNGLYIGLKTQDAR